MTFHIEKHLENFITNKLRLKVLFSDKYSAQPLQYLIDQDNYDGELTFQNK